MLVAYEFSTSKVKQVVLAGKPDSPELRAMLIAVHSRFVPNKIVLSADGGAGQEFLARRMNFLKDIGMIDNKPTAYVCEGYTCQAPTADIATMLRILDRAKVSRPATQP